MLKEQYLGDARSLSSGGVLSQNRATSCSVLKMRPPTQPFLTLIEAIALFGAATV